MVEQNRTEQNRTEQNYPDLKQCQVLIKQATKIGYIACDINGVFDTAFPTSKFRRGRVQGKGQICPTLTTMDPSIVKIEMNRGENRMEKKQKYRIRKLTPHECWRLMNFDEKSFENASQVVSNSQLYKQAGNSIVVACIIAIYMQLGIKNVPKWNDLSDEERYRIIYRGCYETENQ